MFPHLHDGSRRRRGDTENRVGVEHAFHRRIDFADAVVSKRSLT
jgi:hypothetical protein